MKKPSDRILEVAGVNEANMDTADPVVFDILKALSSAGSGEYGLANLMGIVSQMYKKRGMGSKVPQYPAFKKSLDTLEKWGYVKYRMGYKDKTKTVMEPYVKITSKGKQIINVDTSKAKAISSTRQSPIRMTGDSHKKYWK